MAQKRREEEYRKVVEDEHRQKEIRQAEEAKRIEEARCKAEEAKNYSERELQRTKAGRCKNECCQHCGGDFKRFLGIFAKKCRNYGLPKDY